MDRRHFIKVSAAASLGLNLTITDGWAATSIEPDLDRLVPDWLQTTKTPGASVAVIREGKVHYNKAFGVKSTASSKAVDVDTVFEAASVSKTVFAYAVMKLVEQNVISLDAPLSSYYAEPFEGGDARLKEITARQVLSHQSGLAEWRNGDQGIYFQNYAGQFNYSGEGYYLLQTVITHLRGKFYKNPCGQYEGGVEVCATDISEYLQRQVLAPMKMNGSSYLWSDGLKQNAATPHDVNGRPIDKASQTSADMARYASAGGLLTNAKEYARFLIALLEDHNNDPLLLSASSVSKMFSPQVKLPAGLNIDGCTHWALGWGVIERPMSNLMVHSGGQSGFRSLAMLSPQEGNGFAIFTNGDNGGRVVFNLGQALGYLS